jgi:uncharacterized RDD family membrane protein YckC
VLPIFGASRRALHDLLSGTVVVAEPVRLRPRDPRPDLFRVG